MIIFKKVFGINDKYAVDDFLKDEVVKEELSPKLQKDCIRPMVFIYVHYLAPVENMEAWEFKRAVLQMTRITLKDKKGRFVRVYRDYESKITDFFDSEVNGKILSIEMSF